MKKRPKDHGPLSVWGITFLYGGYNSICFKMDIERKWRKKKVMVEYYVEEAEHK